MSPMVRSFLALIMLLIVGGYGLLWAARTCKRDTGSYRSFWMGCAWALGIVAFFIIYFAILFA